VWSKLKESYYVITARQEIAIPERSSPAYEVTRPHKSWLCVTIGFVYAFRVALTFLWFQSSPAQGTIISVSLSLALFCAALLYTAIFESTHDHSIALPPTLKYIFAYLALALISLLWTTTESSFVAFGYWAAMSADVLTIVVLVARQDAEWQVVQVMRGFVFASAIVAAVAWCAPTMNDLRLGNEDFLHPNAIGFEFAIATLCTLYLAREGTIWKILGAVVGVSLVRSLSKASIIAFAVAAGFYLLREPALRRRTKIILVLGSVLGLGAFLGLIDVYVEQYTQDSQLETVTGRTFIWAESLDIALERPWIGHGFYSYRWIVPPFGTFEAWQAHNEALQQFFSYGLSGLFISSALYYSFLRQLRRDSRGNLRTLAASLLIFSLVRGLVDTDIFGLSFPLWLMAALTLALQESRASRSFLNNNQRHQSSGEYLISERRAGQCTRHGVQPFDTTAFVGKPLPGPG
jgi:exopolysaccharide production protein ExoQ